MNIKSFLKDKLLEISLLIFAIASIEIFLIPYKMAQFIKWYIPIILVLVHVIAISIEYVTKRNFYKNLQNNLNELEQKYLITEIIKMPDFTEGRLLKTILQEINKSMAENVNYYKYMRRRLQRIHRVMDS